MLSCLSQYLITWMYSLMSVLHLQVHRLVIVDEQEVVKGIVSLSDILQALVLTNGDDGSA